MNRMNRSARVYWNLNGCKLNKELIWRLMGLPAAYDERVYTSQNLSIETLNRNNLDNNGVVMLIVSSSSGEFMYDYFQKCH
jgi:hypothetical protein